MENMLDTIVQAASRLPETNAQDRKAASPVSKKNRSHHVKIRREVVAERLQALGRPATEIDRRGQLAAGFIGDLIEGRKAGIRDRNLHRLATALEVDPEELVIPRAEKPVKHRLQPLDVAKAANARDAARGAVTAARNEPGAAKVSTSTDKGTVTLRIEISFDARGLLAGLR